MVLGVNNLSTLFQVQRQLRLKEVQVGLDWATRTLGPSKVVPGFGNAFATAGPTGPRGGPQASASPPAARRFPAAVPGDAANMLQKREKVLLLRTFQGRTLRIVREHYLRPSVPCNSPLCPQPAACRNGQGREGPGRTGPEEGGRTGSEEGGREAGA